MNATTILSTTKICIDSVFMKIQGFLVFYAILVLSSWWMTGPGPHILAHRGPQPKAIFEAIKLRF